MKQSGWLFVGQETSNLKTDEYLNTSALAVRR